MCAEVDIEDRKAFVASSVVVAIAVQGARFLEASWSLEVDRSHKPGNSVEEDMIHKSRKVGKLMEMWKSCEKVSMWWSVEMTMMTRSEGRSYKLGRAVAWGMAGELSWAPK